MQSQARRHCLRPDPAPAPAGWPCRPSRQPASPLRLRGGLLGPPASRSPLLHTTAAAAAPPAAAAAVAAACRRRQNPATGRGRTAPPIAAAPAARQDSRLPRGPAGGGSGGRARHRNSTCRGSRVGRVTPANVRAGLLPQQRAGRRRQAAAHPRQNSIGPTSLATCSFCSLGPCPMGTTRGWSSCRGVSSRVACSCGSQGAGRCGTGVGCTAGTGGTVSLQWGRPAGLQ